MKMITLKSAFLAGLLALSSAPALAIPFVSQAGGGSCVQGEILGGGACTTVAIGVHSAWQSNDPLGQGAEWVSYDQTGVGGTVVAPYHGAPGNEDGLAVIISLTEVFEFGDFGGHLSFSVWADDTANIYIDDVLVVGASPDMDVCGAGSIGCQPEDRLEYAMDFGSGAHTLRFDAFQTGFWSDPDRNPFGILYSGNFILYSGNFIDGEIFEGENGQDQVNPIPEPSAAMLFVIGAGLLRAGVRRKV